MFSESVLFFLKLNCSVILLFSIAYVLGIFRTQNLELKKIIVYILTNIMKTCFQEMFPNTVFGDMFLKGF